MVTSKDVALKVGVSVSTVSRVFSNSGLISEKVRQKVLEAAKELHYIPNGNARNLKLNKSNTYGFVISNSGNPFYIKVMKSYLNSINGDSSQLFVTFSEENSKTELSNIKSLLSSNVKALCFTPTSDASNEITEMVIPNKVPTLQLFRRKFAELDSLIIDDAYGTYLAVKELLRNGHKRIILFDANVKIKTYRCDGYRRAFAEAGLEVDPALLVQIPFGYTNAYLKICECMDNLKPTAVISVGSEKTHLVFRYLNEHNLKIKDDVSMIAYDDIDMAEHLDVSVITHPFDEIGDAIMAIIKEREENPSAPVIKITLRPFLKLRDSVKRI